MIRNPNQIKDRISSNEIGLSKFIQYDKTKLQYRYIK